MALFGLHTTAPHLKPELSDTELGRICRKIHRPPAAPDARDFLVGFVDRFVDEAVTDWERRWLRIAVLAETAAESGFDQTWLSRRPSSANALLVNVWTDAVRARRGDRITTLSSAVRRCHQAAAMRPHDPLPWVALLGLLRLLGNPRSQVEMVWREATHRDPWNREAHLQMLACLSEGEFGGPGLAREFVEVQRARMPADAPTGGLELTAAVKAFHRATTQVSV